MFAEVLFQKSDIRHFIYFTSSLKQKYELKKKSTLRQRDKNLNNFKLKQHICIMLYILYSFTNEPKE